jgi:class 3 adenylate cyclase
VTKVAEAGYVNSSGLNIAFRVVGDGPPVLGIGDYWGHTERDWNLPPLRRVWSRFASFSTLVTYDRRGTAMSDPIPPEATHTLEDAVEDIVAVLDELGIASATLFTAASAVPLGLLFAASYPGRTTSLIAYNGYARFIRGDGQEFGLDHDVVDAFREMILSNWGKQHITQMAGPGVDWTEETMDAATTNMRFTASPSVARVLFPLLYECDVRSALPRVETPALIMHSIGSPLVSIDHGRYLAASIPGARYVELPGADHYFWGSDWEAICDESERFVTGTLSVPIERALATILFTDIVNSTAEASRRGDREWAALLDHHDATVRSVVASFRGREVKSTGDGLLARFDSPAGAVRCGSALRDALRRIGIEIRVGIHSGEVEERGDDLGGIAVHIAARVEAAAASGEVLASRTVVDLVAGSGLAFTSRGSHVLKGVPGDWELFAALQ